MNKSISALTRRDRERLIHIVEEGTVNGESLAIIFRLEGYATRTFTSLTDFFDAVNEQAPDMVILSLGIGAGAGMAALRRFKASWSGTPVLTLADGSGIDGAVAAMKSGAWDVIGEPIDTSRLLRSVDDALRADVQFVATGQERRWGEIQGFSRLTPREREVLELITSGQSNKEAGLELGISPRTVEVHRARVMEKLGARNAADLIRIVLTG
jgi:FixJ family two-component response regulator